MMNRPSIFQTGSVVLLRLALLAGLGAAGWTIYSRLPHAPLEQPSGETDTTLQIILRPSAMNNATPLNIAVELYPVDIVAVRHEYFTERRAGKRFDDFLNERMAGRTPVSAKLDTQGQTAVKVTHGNWWLHALLAGEEELEWRLPVTVSGRKQTVELTPDNVYTRTRSF